jgi:hypothetical protein
VDVWTYFEQKKREFDQLSLRPITNVGPMFAAERGSNGKRGKVLGLLGLTDDAYLKISETVVVRGKNIHRIEYAYFLVIDGEEVWGFERDLSHDPAVHYHIGPDHTREAGVSMPFKKAVTLAWHDVTEHYQRVVPTPLSPEIDEP